MKVSYNWLKEYVPELPKEEKLRDVFTYHLCEVENVEKKGKDVIFDLNILPNRAHDLLSHQGIARELAGQLGLKFIDPAPKYKIPKSKPTKLEINADKTRRYMGRVVRGVKVGPSPRSLSRRLESIGQRSINNIVDAANFVMFDSGQPIHCFDWDKIKGKIFVGEAKKGDKIITLDNKEISLGEEDVVIADSLGPLAIAGVKGGKRAEVSKSTKNILIESANFFPALVRRTARRIGILTDAAKRFENDLSPWLCDPAMKEISSLFAEYGFADFEDVVDVYPFDTFKGRLLHFSAERISKILGLKISAGEIEKILQNYKYEYVRKESKFSAKGGPALGWEISVPPLRLDLEIEEDMAEEVGRVLGYDKIKPKIPNLKPGFKGSPKPGFFKPKINETFYKILWARKKLLEEGYSEVMTYTFREKGKVEVLKSASDKKFLRPNLSDGLKESYELNKINAPLLRQSEIKIFEIGTVFTSDTEQTHVAYADKKGVVEKSLDEFCKDIKITESYNELLGARSPSFAKATAGKQKPEAKFKMWSLYPFIIRDISVWLPETASKKELAQILKKNAGELLVHEPWLIDEYKKEGRTSYAFRLVFQAMDRTLTDEEVNEIMEKIGEKMAKKGWQVR